MRERAFCWVAMAALPISKKGHPTWGSGELGKPRGLGVPVSVVSGALYCLSSMSMVRGLEWG